LLLDFVELLRNAGVDGSDDAFEGVNVVLGARDVRVQGEIRGACSAGLVESGAVIEVDDDWVSRFVNHDVRGAEVVVSYPQSMEMAKTLSNASNQNITVELGGRLATTRHATLQEGCQRPWILLQVYTGDQTGR